MAFLEIRCSIFINVFLIILGLFLAGFLLLFGVANLIHPDVPEAYLKQNTITCLVICCISILPLLLSVAAFRGLLLKKKIEREEFM